MYNIFTTTDKAFRDKEYDNLIHLYYQSLSKTIKLLGSNPEKLFSFNDLQNELKNCGEYTLILTPVVIQVSQADPSDLTDLDDLCDNLADGANSKKIDFTGDLSEKSQLVYERRINDLVEDIVRLGYLQKI